MRMQQPVYMMWAIAASGQHTRGLSVTFVSVAKTGSWNVAKNELKRKDIDTEVEND